MDRRTASALVRHVLDMRYYEDTIFSLPQGLFFGVFTTIIRRNKIHGCMGVFHDENNQIEHDQLLRMVSQSLYNAQFTKMRERQNLIFHWKWIQTPISNGIFFVSPISMYQQYYLKNKD